MLRPLIDPVPPEVAVADQDRGRGDRPGRSGAWPGSFSSAVPVGCQGASTGGGGAMALLASYADGRIESIVDRGEIADDGWAGAVGVGRSGRRTR